MQTIIFLRYAMASAILQFLLCTANAIDVFEKRKYLREESGESLVVNSLSASLLIVMHNSNSKVFLHRFILLHPQARLCSNLSQHKLSSILKPYTTDHG